MYLHVGTDEINNNLIISVNDFNVSCKYKPSGGLWFTKHISNKYNEWIDLILENPYIYFSRHGCENIFNIPCCLIKLKDNSNIYNLDSIDNYNYLLNNYSNGNDWFSFEKLSNDYDGIYVNLCKFRLNNNNDILSKLNKYGIDSLILFDTNSIEYYYSGCVIVEPFDYECSSERHQFHNYNIIFNDRKKYIGIKERKRVI